MFELTIVGTDLLKNSISTIAELIDEGSFKVTKNHVSFIAADRAMVAVVDLKLLPTAFEEYKVDKDCVVSVNMLNFISVLRRADASDKITLKTEEDGNKLRIILSGNSVRKFEIPILNIPESEMPPTDQLDFSTKVELKSDVLEQGIADAEVVADSILFEIGANSFKMKAEGDSSVAEMVLERGNESLLRLDAKDSVHARYPLDYLKKMIKAAKLSSTATLQIGTDYPMRLDFTVVDKAKLGFVLAPRVEES